MRGRTMEMSNQVNFNGHLLSPDDKTVMIFEIEGKKVVNIPPKIKVHLARTSTFPDVSMVVPQFWTEKHHKRNEGGVDDNERRPGTRFIIRLSADIDEKYR